jgi:hypothetical protein
LKQVPEKLVPPIVPLRVGALQPLHAYHQVAFRRVHQQMIMIALEHTDPFTEEVENQAIAKEWD